MKGAAAGGALRRAERLRSTSWENVARVLEAVGGAASDTEIAHALACGRELVARVRRDLKMPPRPVPSLQGALTPEQRVILGAVLTSGGHRRWVGRTTGDGVPLVDHRTTVARVVFRMTYGREPEGQVRAGCVRKHCVAGLHLTDRRMRQERAALGTAGGAR